MSRNFVIFPAIGIARVGNAPNEYFLAPEVPGQVARPPYKDERGRVKRQVAQFRIYETDDDGHALREITADEAEIEWRVHLANRKAIWYQFNNAMDLGQYAKDATFRNASHVGPDRQRLLIDPGPRAVSGRNARSEPFDSGEFLGKKVYLGELATDDKGRLRVFGGWGHSASADGSPATTFANNDGWHDDTADGPVFATVKIDGESHRAEPAMVAVAPPNFGHGLYSVVTLYDVVLDLFIRENWLPAPAEIRFWENIYPIFGRLVGNQWVNQGMFFLFGKNSPSDFSAPDLLAQLSSPAESDRRARERLFEWFRNPDSDVARPALIPPYYGDAFGDFEGTPIDELSVTRTQYGMLQRWAAGDFTRDSDQLPDRPSSLAALPIEAQPDSLDRAALEDCLGGPFHPGIELTWFLRVARMWKRPFRLNQLPEGESPSDDFGPILTPQICLGPDGPLTASGPGTLTRWMGVPWQTDEASCLSGYDPSTYLPLPTFWCARVPNEVLSHGSYQRLMDVELPLAQRYKHLDYRQFWLRDLGVAYSQRINNMIAEWDKIAIIGAQPGPSDHAEHGLPETIWVEMGRAARFSARDPSWKQLLRAEEAQPEVAALEFAAEEAAIPAERRRPTYRRNER